MAVFLEWVGGEDRVPRDRTAFGRGGTSELISYRKRPHCMNKIVAYVKNDLIAEELQCSAVVPYEGPFDYRFRPHDDEKADIVGNIANTLSSFTKEQLEELNKRLPDALDSTKKVIADAEGAPRVEAETPDEPEPEAVEEVEEPEDEEEPAVEVSTMELPATYRWLINRGAELVSVAERHLGKTFPNLPAAASAMSKVDPPLTRRLVSNMLNSAAHTHVPPLPKDDEEE